VKTESTLGLPSVDDPEFDAKSVEIERATEATYAAAANAIVPTNTLRPASPESLLELQLLVDACPPNAVPNLVKPLLQLHAEALAGENWDLCEAIRSPRALRLIRTRAAFFAEDAALVQRAIDAFVKGLAQQLFDLGLALPHSRVVVDVPRQREQLARARASRAECVRAERERVARETAEADESRRAAARAEREREWAAIPPSMNDVEKRLALRDVINRNPGCVYQIGDERLTTQEMLRDLALGRPFSEMWTAVHRGGEIVPVAR
jgi:hypothetical protein